MKHNQLENRNRLIIDLLLQSSSSPVYEQLKAVDLNRDYQAQICKYSVMLMREFVERNTPISETKMFAFLSRVCDMYEYLASGGDVTVDEAGDLAYEIAVYSEKWDVNSYNFMLSSILFSFAHCGWTLFNDERYPLSIWLPLSYLKDFITDWLYKDMPTPIQNIQHDLNRLGAYFLDYIRV